MKLLRLRQLHMPRAKALSLAATLYVLASCSQQRMPTIKDARTEKAAASLKEAAVKAKAGIKEGANEVARPVKEGGEGVKDFVTDIKRRSSDDIAAIKEGATQVAQPIRDAASAVQDRVNAVTDAVVGPAKSAAASVKEGVNQAAQPVKEAASQTKTAANEATKPVVESAKDLIPSSSQAATGGTSPQPEEAANTAPTLTNIPGVITYSYYVTAADKVELKGVVRDFPITPGRKTNPDFEAYVGSKKGLVASTLGTDGNPVFIGTPGELVTSAASFAQWWTTIEGVNMEFPLTLTLSKNSAGVYSFANIGSFFPIDNMGFGNEGTSLNHNYGFCSVVETTFTYHGKEYFKISGDDDVWLFVDKKLAIDLGGVHPTETATIELDDLSLTVGNDYSLKLFVCERAQAGSSLALETTIQPKNSNPFEFTVQARDPDSDTLRFALKNAPRGMVIDASTGKISWLPTEGGFNGSHKVQVVVSDNKGASEEKEFTLQVNPAPSFGGAPSLGEVFGLAATLRWRAPEDDATQENELDYKVVYKIIGPEDAWEKAAFATVEEANSISTPAQGLAMDWTTLPHSEIQHQAEKVITGLSSDTHYSFTILARDKHGSIGMSKNIFVRTLPQKTIHVTAPSQDRTIAAILGDYARAGSSLETFDTQFCGANKKALLVGTILGSTRKACATPHCEQGRSENENWVMTPYTEYKRSSDNLVVGTTNAAGVFSFPLNAAISAGSTTVTTTGLKSDWTTGDTCNNYSQIAMSAHKGEPGASDAKAFSSFSSSCGSSFMLYCVEQ